MSLKRLVFKNTFYQTASQVFSIAIGMAVNMVLSRYLGVEGFGRYNYVFAFYFFFLSLNDFGTNTVVIREISKNREKAGDILSSVLGMKLLLSALCIFIAWGVIFGMNRPPELKTALYLYAFMLPVLAMQLPLIIFQIDLKMEYPSFLGIGNRLLQFMLLMTAAWKNWGLPGLIAALVIADATFIPIYWFFSQKLARISVRFDLKIWKSILRSSIPLGLAGLLGLFTNQANFIFLEKMGSIKDVGYYSAAFRITTLFQLLPIMVMTTLYPIMSRYASQNPQKLRNLYDRCQVYLVLAGLALGGLVTIAAPLVIRIIFGTRFIPAAQTLTILIWSIVFLYFSIGAGNILISMGHEKMSLVNLGAGGLVNITLNYFLIPRWGHLGAAWATTLAFSVIALITLTATEYYLRKAEKTFGVPPPRCVFLTKVGGRAHNIKNALIKKGFEVEEFDCANWFSMLKYTPDYLVALRHCKFIFAGMNFPWQIFWLLGAQLMGRKVVLDCPVDVIEKPFAVSWHRKKIIRFFARRADIFLTLASRSYLIEKLGLSRDRVLFFENCPDLEKIEHSKHLTPQFNFPSGGVTICYSGVASWHGIERFIPIFKSLKVQLPNVSWLVIGDPSEPSIAHLQKQVQEEGLGDSVYFHPVIKPFEHFLATVYPCDLWLSHFDSESILGRHELRTELLEMGALGKAAAGVKTPALEMHGFRDEEEILLLDLKRPEQSAEKLAKYLRDRNSLNRLGMNLQNFVQNKFSLEESVTRMLTALSERSHHAG